MNEYLIAVVLGIIEGLTEFLPISSTGHLIIINQFISFSEEFTKTFDVVIQLGAILSVVVYFWDKLFPFGGNKTSKEKQKIWTLWFKTVVGVLPAIVVGAFAADFIDEKLFNPITVSLALFIGGIILILLENRRREGRINDINRLGYNTAFFIGVFQCLGMIPGTSRSAATIIGAMILGASRVVAAEFSFFLAIPTMVAASGYKLLKTGINMTSSEFLVLGVGFVISFIVALAVIAGFMSFIKKRSFRVFGYYRIVLGALVFLYFTMIK